LPKGHCNPLTARWIPWPERIVDEVAFAPYTKRRLPDKDGLQCGVMSTSSLFVSDSNPVTAETLREIFSSQLPGVQFSDRDEEDYLVLLQALHETLTEVDNLPGGL
jgi:hypothetical protein